jgi:hypothetical protein
LSGEGKEEEAAAEEAEKQEEEGPRERNSMVSLRDERASKTARRSSQQLEQT